MTLVSNKFRSKVFFKRSFNSLMWLWRLKEIHTFVHRLVRRKHLLGWQQGKGSLWRREIIHNVNDRNDWALDFSAYSMGEESASPYFLIHFISSLDIPLHRQGGWQQGVNVKLCHSKAAEVIIFLRVKNEPCIKLISPSLGTDGEKGADITRPVLILVIHPPLPGK